MNKKVLIVYATAGIGHKKAAEAIHEAIKRDHENVDVRLVDVLDYTDHLFGKAYPAAYLLLINRLIFLWGLLYYLSDIKLLHLIFYRLRRLLHVINSRKFISYLLDYRPDVVVATHFMVADVCYYAGKRYGLKTRVINLITDYMPHSFWISSGVDTYFVAHQETRRVLQKKWRVSRDRVIVTGIPVATKFCIKHDKDAIRKKLGIPSGSFAALLLGGGYGMGPMFGLLTELNRSDFPITVITVCGHNKDLYKKVESFKADSRINILNFSFVDNIDELMAASNVYIGKAGGISITEALAQDLPSIFIRPIPGQEKRNADLFINMGVGLKARGVDDILSTITQVRTMRNSAASMTKRVSRMKKVFAAETIANLI
ncbi:MAG: glycosyltransferase [Candidatus Omnitrophota bacterium]